MRNLLIAFGLLVAGTGAVGAQPQACLHGSGETATEAGRRLAALDYARQVNTLEAVGKRQALSFYEVSDLPGLPKLPEGFAVRMSTNGASYMFAVKDTLDPCHFAYFSDDDGVIYTAMPVGTEPRK